MRRHFLTKHYSRIIPWLSLTALLLLAYTNCAEVKISPVELHDPQSLNVSVPLPDIDPNH
jgi:hypothetical protein